MEIGVLLAFAAVAIPLGAVPGPEWVFMLATSARYRVVLRAAAGLALGHVLIVAAIALGLGPLVTAVPAILNVLTIVGGLYLLYLGISVLRAPAPASTTSAEPETLRPWRLFGQSFAVAAFNPKALIFYLALIPQFIRPEAAWPLPAQITVFGLFFAACCITSAIFAGYAAHRFIGPRPRLNLVITRIAGIIMLVLGVILLVEQAVHFATHG